MGNIDEDNENFYNGYDFILKFRKQRLENRLRISDEILLKHSSSVPIIVDAKKDIKLNKNKYIVPRNLSIGQFLYVLKKKINIKSNESIFLLCNKTIVPNTELIRNFYESHKDEDGFLYIIVTLENTFGN